MKLMDWDEEEEKAGRTEKGSRLKSDPDFGEETSDRDSGEHKPDFHERLRRGSTDREEELAPLAMWAKVLIFIGLAVLAALICAVLWNFVHPDKPEENQNSLPGNIEASGDNSAPAQDLPSGAEDGNGESSAPDTEYVRVKTRRTPGSPTVTRPRILGRRPARRLPTASRKLPTCRSRNSPRLPAPGLPERHRPPSPRPVPRRMRARRHPLPETVS